MRKLLDFCQKSLNSWYERWWKVSIFGHNGKPIALLFGENCSIFAKNHSIDWYERWWKVSIFGRNGKPIALLLCENCLIFAKNHWIDAMNDHEIWAFLAEIVMPIALLLWRNLLDFWQKSFNSWYERCWKVSILGHNCKPIALLFGEICSIFSKNYSTIELKDDGKWAFLAKMVSL